MKGICWLCGNYEELETHHIFPGRALRPVSEKYGATVKLCPWCHRIDRDAVHNCRETRKTVQEYGQRKVMREQGWSREQFAAVFGKNYLDDEPETERDEGESFFALLEAEPAALPY